MTLTQRLELIDLKIEKKHARVRAETEKTARAIRGLKACSDTSRTRMSIKAFRAGELEDPDAESVEDSKPE